MERDPLIPRDEAGIARRFQSHREAMRWAFGSVGRWGLNILSYYVVPAIGLVVWQLYKGDLTLSLFGVEVFLAISVLFGSWVSASVLLYVYIALSGGVMGREERDGSSRADHE